MAQLQLENISLSSSKNASAGQESAAHTLSLNLEGGTVWGVLGENGSGKSTLLHKMAGLELQRNERVLVNGVDVRKMPRKVLAQRVGLMFQHEPNRLPFTVYDWVMAGRYPHVSVWGKERAEDRKIVEWALAQTELLELRKADISKLSPTQRARLDFALVLAQQPDIYLLDEPTGQLDILRHMSLLEQLRNWIKKENKILCISIYDPRWAATLCDKVLLLSQDGHWQAGDVKQMLQTDKLAQAYSHPLIGWSKS